MSQNKLTLPDARRAETDMASAQKRWLTQPNSKLGKRADLAIVLRKEDAWNKLPATVRAELYALLPPPQEGEPSYNIDVHPLKTGLKCYIEGAIRRWQTDLNDGKETKKWRDDAMQASQERASGAWKNIQEQMQEEEWRVKERKPPEEPKALQAIQEQAPGLGENIQEEQKQAEVLRSNERQSPEGPKRVFITEQEARDAAKDAASTDERSGSLS